MESNIGDDFDTVTDLRLARRLKRRRLDIEPLGINTFTQSLKRNLEFLKLGDGMEDEDYIMYLNNLSEHSESGYSVSEDGDDIDESVEEDDVDPQYKMFLEKLRVNGNSYVLEVPINNEMSLSVRYEADEGFDGECEPVALSKWREVLNTEKIGAAKDLRDVPSKDKMETQKNLNDVMSKDRIDATKSVRDDIGGERMDFVVEKDLNPEPVNHVSGKTEGCSTKIPSPNANCLFEVESEHEMEADMVDECYQTVLDCIKVEGDCVGFTINGKSVKYEGRDIETADSEVLEYNASDFDEGNYNPIKTSKLSDSFEDEQHCLGSPSTSKHYGFREMLMQKLRESYDHEEYEKLWHDINEHRPKKGRHRDLRGVGALKTFLADGCPSPSYLDQHDVLRRKIDAVQFDRRKVLNLLRGFFFWLQGCISSMVRPFVFGGDSKKALEDSASLGVITKYALAAKSLVREDAFPPWLDPSCLAVISRKL
ncbi:unnamed protein product [Camellia sinensis]